MPNNLTEMHVKRDSSSFLNVIIISTKLNKRPSCLISHPSIIDYIHNNDLPFLSEILQQGLYYEIYNFGTQQICKYDSHVCLGGGNYGNQYQNFDSSWPGNVLNQKW